MEDTSQQRVDPYEALMQDWRQEIPAQLCYSLENFAQRHLIYGTENKGDQTAELVYQAIKAGFRAIATASQPLHYREDLVGLGVRRAIDEGLVKRGDLFVSLTSPLSLYVFGVVKFNHCTSVTARSKRLLRPTMPKARREQRNKANFSSRTKSPTQSIPL